MTKKLTEQWKDMDLADEHLYYWRMPNGEVRIMSKMGVCSYKLCYDGGEIDILAPVPSYDEWKRLLYKRADHLSQLAKKVERLQEQLNEAVVILMRFERVTPFVIGGKYLEGDLERFYKKWGVK